MSTKIEWTDETWNPIRARNRATGGVGHFCVHKSPGCKHCYAEPMQRRLFNNPIRYAAQDANKVELFLDEKVALKPLSWRKPRRVFVCSMTDLFLENHPEEWILDVWVNMALAHTHTFQVLTKRPERMRAFVDKCRGEVEFLYEAVMEGVPVRQRREFQWPLLNVWLGVSAEDQQRADERVPILRRTPAAKRFLSAEPLLGPIDLERGGWALHRQIVPPRGRPLPGLDWIIVGGESGPEARPMDSRWALEIRDECRSAGVAYFHKQNGEFLDERALAQHDWIDVDQSPEVVIGEERYFRVGKKRAGRLLDGREWNGMPA